MAPHQETIRNLFSRSIADFAHDITSSAYLISRSANPAMSLAHSETLPRRLTARTSSTYIPCVGCTSPKHINNKAFFGLFALLGAAMVIGSIWFFFWAKNGGFQWRSNDWDDYKSTVLRRKGPDGKTLSNATKSTKLGYTGSLHFSKADRFAAMSVVGYDEKGRKGIRAQRGFGGSHSVYYSDGFTSFGGDDDDRSDHLTSVSRNNYKPRKQQKPTPRAMEEARGGGHHSRRYRDRDDHAPDRAIRSYRAEAPARVGGMNRPADGSTSNTNIPSTYYSHNSAATSAISGLTDRSSAALLHDKDASSPHKQRDEQANKKRAKAEKKAREEASRMERKWRRDAELAAAALARENARGGTKVPAPSVLPPQQAKRAQREASPKKKQQQQQQRDYSFSRGAADEISTAFTGATGATGTTATTGTEGSGGTRSSSYYDRYRPGNAGGVAGAGPGQQKKEKTKKGQGQGQGRGGRDVMAGYRRGMLEDSDDE